MRTKRRRSSATVCPLCFRDAPGGHPGQPAFCLLHCRQYSAVFRQDVVIPFFVHGQHTQPDHLLAHGVPEFPENGVPQNEKEHRVKRLVRRNEGKQASPGLIHRPGHGGHLPPRLPGEARGEKKLQGVPLENLPRLEHLPKIRRRHRADLDVLPGIHPQPPLLGEAVDRLPDRSPAHAELFGEIPLLQNIPRGILQGENALFDPLVHPGGKIILPQVVYHFLPWYTTRIINQMHPVKRAGGKGYDSVWYNCSGRSRACLSGR